MEPSQSHSISDISSSLNTAATPFRPRPDVFPATQQSVQHQGQSQEPLRQPAPIDDVTVVEEPGPAPSNPSVEKAAVIRFPRISRQRTSNININDPEKEFQQTALDSCRSTIVQQESQIKRQNECLDIRNKRIIQLEAQVGIAAARIGSRNAESDDSSPSTSQTKLEETVQLIMLKLESRSTAPIININNGLHGHHQNLLSQSRNQSSQTEQCEEDVQNAHCPECAKTKTQKDSLDTHMKSPHQPPAVSNFQCNMCEQILLSENELENHNQAIHKENQDLDYAKPEPCDYCGRQLLSVKTY